MLPDPLTIERAGIKAWPGVEMDWDGSWVRRAANGYTRRANSLQCFDPEDGAEAPARLASARAWFEARGLAPVVRTTPLASPGLAAALDAEGWREEGLSQVLAMPLGDDAPDPQGKTFALRDPVFLDAQRLLHGYDADTLDRLRALLGAITVPATGIVMYRDGQPAATSLMAIADGIVITGNVVTDAQRRGQGLASAMMGTGHHWAVQHGARLAALNVDAGNIAAQALYRRLGYVRRYDYSYYVPREAR